MSKNSFKTVAELLRAGDHRGPGDRRAGPPDHDAG